MERPDHASDVTKGERSRIDGIRFHRREGWIPDATYEAVKQHDPTIPQSARVVFEYGKTLDGYWNNQLFM